MARDVLAPILLTDYQQKVIIVFTDDLKNEPIDIADVIEAIDSQTFAIGLGNESQVNTSSLTSRTNSTEGYLFLTEFTREQTLTGAAFRGGDTSSNGSNTGSEIPSSVGQLIKSVVKI